MHTYMITNSKLYQHDNKF